MDICDSKGKSAEDNTLESLVDVHLAFFKKAETFFAVNPGEQWIPKAVTQYALFLQKKNNKEYNEPPPFAVAWIWHLHLLHPVAYKRYCESKFLRVISPVAGDMLSGSLEFSGTAEAQPDIPLPTTHTGTVATWEQLHSNQLAFLMKTKSFAPTRKQVTHLITKFKKFLQLMKLSTGVLVPTIEIDYIWHSCLRDPIFYFYMCRKFAGRLINHNDLLDKVFLQAAFVDTKTLYEKMYPDRYEACKWGLTVPILWVSCAGCATQHCEEIATCAGCAAQHCEEIASCAGCATQHCEEIASCAGCAAQHCEEIATSRGVEGVAVEGGAVEVGELERCGGEVGGCGSCGSG